jgi:hypothetical protein
VQLLALQDRPPEQTVPHAPQLLSFSVVSMQLLLQKSRSPGQLHWLPLHVRPPLQAVLQAPQWDGLLVRFTQLWPHCVSPPAQLRPHWLCEQT